MTQQWSWFQKPDPNLVYQSHTNSNEICLCSSWISLLVHVPFITMTCISRAQCGLSGFTYSPGTHLFDSQIMQSSIYKGDLQGFSKSKSCESNLWVKQLITAVLIKQRPLAFSLVLEKQSLSIPSVCLSDSNLHIGFEPIQYYQPNIEIKSVEIPGSHKCCKNWWSRKREISISKIPQL